SIVTPTRGFERSSIVTPTRGFERSSIVTPTRGFARFSSPTMLRGFARSSTASNLSDGLARSSTASNFNSPISLPVVPLICLRCSSVNLIVTSFFSGITDLLLLARCLEPVVSSATVMPSLEPRFSANLTVVSHRGELIPPAIGESLPQGQFLPLKPTNAVGRSFILGLQIGLGSVQKYHQRALVGLRKGRSVAFRRLSMNHPPTALVRFSIGRFFRTTFRSKIILPTKILHLILI